MNIRTDILHKATSALAVRYQTVIVEDLNVAGMTRNRHLARSIADQGLGEPADAGLKDHVEWRHPPSG